MFTSRMKRHAAPSATGNVPVLNLPLSCLIHRWKLRAIAKSILSGGRRSDQNELMVHIDHASSHTAQMIRNCFTDNGLRELVHLPYSPDITPSDCYLFGKGKKQLIDRSIQHKKLLHEMMEMLDSISTSELQDMFRNWIKRLAGVIETHGEHISSGAISHFYSAPHSLLHR
jgi:hypothetical protein